MERYQWILVVAYVLLIVGFASYLLWMLAALADALVSRKLRQRFKEDLSKAVEHSQPSWTQVLDMASTRGIDHRAAFLVTSALLRDTLTGAEASLNGYRQLLESYVLQYQKSEPFAGLPTETRIHLERLRDALGEKSSALEPLALELRNLTAIHRTQARRQRFYTTGGFILGAVGVAFAAIAYFFPPSPVAAPSKQDSSLASQE